MHKYRVNDINLDKILPRLARYMPNLEQLYLVPCKHYFHAHLSVAALETLQKFSRLTYLDMGYAKAPKIVTMLPRLTQLQCIESAAEEFDVTRVNPSLAAHLTLGAPLIRQVPPLTALTNLRRLRLDSLFGALNVTELFTAPLTRVTRITLQGRQEYPDLATLFPNLERIDTRIGVESLSSLTRLTAVSTLRHIYATQLHGLALRSLSFPRSDMQSFTEFTCLTSLAVWLSADFPSCVDLSQMTQLARLKLGASGKHRQFVVSSHLTRVTLVDEDSTANWSAFTAIHRLTLNYVPIYNARELRVLTNLEQLTFKRCIALEAKSLQYLSALPHLTHLSWQGAQDEGLVWLASCSSLTSLHLMKCTVSGTCVNQLHQLRRLALTDVTLSGDYLSQLYQLEQLKLLLEHNLTPLNVPALHSACHNSLTALVIECRRHLLDEQLIGALKQLTQLKYLHIDN